MNIIKRGKRNVLSRSFHARDNEKAIAVWKLDFDDICRILEVRPFHCEFATITNFQLPGRTCGEGRRRRSQHFEYPYKRPRPSPGHPEHRDS